MDVSDAVMPQVSAPRPRSRDLSVGLNPGWVSGAAVAAPKHGPLGGIPLYPLSFRRPAGLAPPAGQGPRLNRPRPEREAP